MPRPMQNPPTRAIRTADSPKASKKPVIERLRRARSGPRREIENMRSEGRCNGSYESPMQDRVGSPRQSRSRLCEPRTFCSVRVPSRKRLATSWERFATQSDSHLDLSQRGPWPSSTREVSFRRDMWMSSTARSTSRHRRKRSAASLRRVAIVSGEWKSPVRRAKAEEGRKDESFEYEGSWL